MNAKDKLAAGRAKARKIWRYYDTAIYSMIPREAPGLGTVGVTDDWQLHYDPAFIMAYSVDELAVAILHEAGHLLRNHGDRAKKMGVTDEQKHVWNLAGDCELNDDFEAANLKLPHKPGKFEAVYPKTYQLQNGMTAEWYFRELMKKAIVVPPGYVGCGTCAHGGKADPKAPPGEGRSMADSNRIRQAVAEAVVSEASRGRGSVPAGMARWAGEITKPAVIRWQDQFAHVARSVYGAMAGHTDYFFGKPSRKQSGVGYGIGKPVMPALRSPRPVVKFAVDTSGSMSEKNVTDAIIEAGGILKTLGCPIEFIACDAAVHAAKTVRTVQEIIPLIKGGGGTDFVPIFEHIAKSRPPPDILVVATDGMGRAPELAPRFKVIWLLMNSGDRAPVAWGKTIHVNVDKLRSAA